MSNNIRIFEDLQDTKDDRLFQFGEVWQIRDSLISIPNADRIVNGRKIHYVRCVVITQNNSSNWDSNSLNIYVAPISSKVNFKRKYDVTLTPEKDGVKEESIIMMDYIQPVLKKDLYKEVAEISEDAKSEMYVMMGYQFGTYAEVATTKEEKSSE